MQVSSWSRNVYTKGMSGYRYDRITGDRVVSRSPVFVSSIVITSDGGGEADAKLYDGVSTTDPVLLSIYTVDEAMAQLNFNPPLETQRGLFVDIGTNVTEVLIVYSVRKG